MNDLWNVIILPLLWLLAGLGFVVAVMAIFKLFDWLMDKLN